jgi:EAL domain-containing protein (putative c-di-GMP-specific phosphodiesterase class I)
LRTVAEGVEDADVLDMLQNLGCTMAQGFLIARPTTAEVLTTWLRAAPRPQPLDTVSPTLDRTPAGLVFPA